VKPAKERFATHPAAIAELASRNRPQPTGYLLADRDAGRGSHRSESRQSVGIVAGPATPWWIADNATGKSTVYNVSTGTVSLTAVVTPDSLRGTGEYRQRGQLHSATGAPLEIDGLWGLAFGNGAAANGPANTLFFSAGSGDEQHGVFGTIVVARQD
jgi:hypothetical protein